MKKTAIYSLVIFTMMISVSKIQCQSDDDWSLYKRVNCYSGLDFKVKRFTSLSVPNPDHKYEWHVKFRNRYNERIYFNCILTNPGVSTAKGTDRLWLKPGEEYSTWFIVQDPIEVALFIDSVKFGNDLADTPYANCDY